MLKIELHNRDPQRDPVPCFASSTEIEIAEELRHQLEKRLLAPSAPSAALAVSLSDTPDEAPSPSSSYRHEQS